MSAFGSKITRPEDLGHCARRLASETIPRVKPGIFGLTDAVVAAFPDRAWDAIVSDEVGAHFLSTHLDRVLTVVAHLNGVQAPRLLPIANSRSTYQTSSEERARHAGAIEAHLAHQGIRKALLATEFIDSGQTACGLAGILRSLGVRVDFAVLESRNTIVDVLKNKLAPSGSGSNLYTPPDLWGESLLVDTYIKEASGRATQLGSAEPAINNGASAELVQMVHKAFAQLTADYLQQLQAR